MEDTIKALLAVLLAATLLAAPIHAQSKVTASEIRTTPMTPKPNGMMAMMN